MQYTASVFLLQMGVCKLCSNGIAFGQGKLVLYVASGGMQEEVSSNKKVSVKANRCLLRQAAKQNLCCLCNSLSAITAQFTLNRVIFLTFARFKTCSVWPSEYLQDLQKVSSEQFVLQPDAPGLPHIVNFRTKSKDFFGTLCQNRHVYATELSFYLYDYTAPIFSVIQDLQNIFILFMFCKLSSDRNNFIICIEKYQSIEMKVFVKMKCLKNAVMQIWPAAV